MTTTPLDKKRHLLVCIMEEAAEIQQAACKALRFGMDDTNPKTGKTNLEEMLAEYHELHAVMGQFYLCFDERPLSNPPMHDVKDAKVSRLKHWMEYAKEKGTLA